LNFAIIFNIRKKIAPIVKSITPYEGKLLA